MKSLRLLCLGALLGLTTPLSSHAQDKPHYTETEAAKHVGEEATVTGKVVAVSKSGKGTTYLNFGDRFPRHVFSGVVLARDEAAAGDMKQYEGKTVAVTGRIDLSQDEKPQIMISKPEQIKLAEDAPPPPAAPAPMPAPAPPAATPVPQAPSAPPPVVNVAPPMPKAALPATPTVPEVVKKIALAPNWNSPVQGGELTRKDLATIFGTQGSASTSTEGNPMIEVYPEVPFLLPLAQAKKRLNLESITPSKTKVACPGLPVGSFSAYGFAGIFPGGFNHLYLVTDNADQVVSVLTVDENSRQRTPELTDTGGFHTYNFINLRVKGTNDLIIKHVVATEAPAGVVIVDSMLVDPHDAENPPPKTGSKTGTSGSKTSGARGPRTGKVMERSRWYVPQPVVNLILRCVSGR